jgi:hypothetical protein
VDRDLCHKPNLTLDTSRAPTICSELAPAESRGGDGHAELVEVEPDLLVGSAWPGQARVVQWIEMREIVPVSEVAIFISSWG